MLENLEEWWVEKGGLPKLEEMEIRGWGKLKRFDGLEHLPTLKELVLTNMQQMLGRVRSRCWEEIWHSIAHERVEGFLLTCMINARGGQNMVQSGTSLLKNFQPVLPPVHSTLLV
ncbi:hypothetical protein RHMOL_Rhmol09G0053500 [Rhododendron molle]|uniref:Uncharacterized protein n=1 Tax=Rhododendron molle TaxID=49168 RepID=A0ACC0MA30_RHOML|nr:hypothetical protein RHMOL_Rhmol09G0053500 [Rhododendron molle]